MPRPEHPLIVATIDALARQFGVAPADLWAWMDRTRKAPRWFVDAAVQAFDPILRETDFDVDESLPSAPKHVTFGAMQATKSSSKAPRRMARWQVDAVAKAIGVDEIRLFEGAKPTDHPFVNALREKGVTLTEWCAKHRLKREAVKGWYTTGVGARRIPRRWAKAIEAELGLPADATIWANGIRD